MSVPSSLILFCKHRLLRWIRFLLLFYLIISFMTNHRQIDYQVSKLRARLNNWNVILQVLGKRRLTARNSSFTRTPVFITVAENVQKLTQEYQGLISRSNRISSSSFYFNFNAFTDSDCIRQFRFKKRDVLELVSALRFPNQFYSTSRNRYSTSGLLSTCVLLRRLSSAMNWNDMELMFGKHGSHLFEIFWEAVQKALDERGHLLHTSVLPSLFFKNRLQLYADATYAKGGALKTCVGLIDGTLIGISRSGGGYMQQLVAYNGHKKKHALKFQVISAPDGLVLHCYGPMEGRRHDWTLYAKSDVDDLLETSLNYYGKQYCIYGDMGYNSRSFLHIPYDGSHLTAHQTAFNKAMSTIRIPVEWVFKEVKQYFPLMDFPRKLKVNQAPVGSMYLLSILLTNFRTWIYGNPTSAYFLCFPPSINEYINCDQ